VQLEKAQQQADDAQRELVRVARLAGGRLCEQGDAAEGLVLLTRCLKHRSRDDGAGSASDRSASLLKDLPELQKEFDKWRGQVHPLRAVLTPRSPIVAAAFHKTRTLVTAGEDGVLRVYALGAGHALGAGLLTPPLRGGDGTNPVEVPFVAASASDPKSASDWKGSLLAVGFNPDGRVIVAAGRQQTVRLILAGSDKLWGQPLEHTADATVRLAAIGSEGLRVVTATADGKVWLWDVTAAVPRPELLFEQDGLKGLACSRDGRVVAVVGEDDTARVRDLTGSASDRKSERSMWVVPVKVKAVAVSADGRRVLTGSEDGTARLWETATGKQLGSPMRHLGSVRAVAVCPECRILFTATQSFDQEWQAKARLWDVMADGQRPPAERPNERVLTSPRDQVDKLVLTIQVLTGLYLDEQDRVQVLEKRAWEQCKHKLEQLTGPGSP
jgi:WD40 repeat protein